MHHKPMCNMPNAVSPTKTMVCPTKQCAKHNYYEDEVNYVHPTHTTTYNHLNVNNKHFFPQTQSVVNTTSQQNINMGPTSPQAVSPATLGPGGAGPMGPANQVAGAYQGPGPNGPGPMGPMGMGCKPKPFGWR